MGKTRGPKVKKGDRLIVQGMPFRAIVELIHREPAGRVRIILDWGHFGKSGVYEHDEGTVWQRYEDVH